jgi:hypothetical protein
LNNNRVMMAVNMGVDSIKSFEKLADQGRKGLREWNTCDPRLAKSKESNVGKNIPILLGNIDSLSIFAWTHAIKCSTYSGAGIFVGRLKFSESCHKYSNLE